MAIIVDTNKYMQDIIKTSQDTFSQIAAGTHPSAATDDDYKYNELNQYDIELGEPVILGAPGSNSHINGYNQLIIDAQSNGDTTVNDISVVDTADDTAKLSTNRYFGTKFAETETEGESKVETPTSTDKTYRQNVIEVNNAQQYAPHLTDPASDEDLKKVDFTNRANTGDYYADFSKKTINNPGQAVITVKNLDMAVVQALANHKESLIPSMDSTETGRSSEEGYAQSLKFNEDYFITDNSVNPLAVQSAGNKTKASKTIGAIRRIYVKDDVRYGATTYGGGVQPVQALEIDDNRIATLTRASTTGLKDITLGGTGTAEENAAYGVVKLRKDAGLKHYVGSDKAEHQGIIEIDEANAYDNTTEFDQDKKHIGNYDFGDEFGDHNDIYKRTGRNNGAVESGTYPHELHTWTGTEQTKVLTSKYVDSLFKYGLGYYQGKDLQNYEIQATKDTTSVDTWKKYGNPTKASETTPADKPWEQVTACLTIGAVHGIAITERATDGTEIGTDVVVAGNAAKNTYTDPDDTSKTVDSGRVNINLAQPGELSTITYTDEATRVAAVKDFNAFDKTGLITTTNFSGLTYGVADYQDYYSNADDTYKRSRRDGLIAIDIPQLKDKKVTTWTGKRSGTEVTGDLKESEQYYYTDESDLTLLKNGIEDRTGYILKTAEGEAIPTSWATGRTHTDNKTKVLTTRFIDEIFKYGLGHFNPFGRKDITLSDDVIDIDDSTTGRLGTMQILQYGEKHTACNAIGAQRKIFIREVAEV